MEVVSVVKIFLEERNTLTPAQTLPRLSTSIKPKFKLNTIAYRLVIPRNPHSGIS